MLQGVAWASAVRKDLTEKAGLKLGLEGWMRFDREWTRRQRASKWVKHEKKQKPGSGWCIWGSYSYTMHVHSPFPKCDTVPQLSALSPCPFTHLSTSSSDVTSSMKLSLVSLVKLIMVLFVLLFFSFGISVPISHFILPSRVDNYLFPSTLYIT